MSKLSFDALSQRAEQVATEDLLSSINGGTENDCHIEDNPLYQHGVAEHKAMQDVADNIEDWWNDLWD